MKRSEELYILIDHCKKNINRTAKDLSDYTLDSDSYRTKLREELDELDVYVEEYEKIKPIKQ